MPEGYGRPLTKPYRGISEATGRLEKHGKTAQTIANRQLATNSLDMGLARRTQHLRPKKTYDEIRQEELGELTGTLQAEQDRRDASKNALLGKVAAGRSKTSPFSFGPRKAKL